MNKVAIILSMFLSNAIASEKPTIVAIIDTGLDISDPRFVAILCKNGHKDFTYTGLNDTIGHGTHMAGLIKRYAKDANYCLLVIKYADSRDVGERLVHFLQAEEYAVKQGARVVNISAGGPALSVQEATLIRNHPEVKFIVAAGNNNQNISEHPYFPASYRLPNELVVGSITPSLVKSTFSNYGWGLEWEQGDDVLSDWPGGQLRSLSGTSPATAIRTGKYVYENYR